jgi:hypothetical protein
VVECDLAKVEVAGSTPVSRSMIFSRGCPTQLRRFMLSGPAQAGHSRSGRGTQVVRERSAKPLCVGSIPTRASKVSITYKRWRKNWLPFGCQMVWNLAQYSLSENGSHGRAGGNEPPCPSQSRSDQRAGFRFWKPTLRQAWIRSPATSICQM